MCSVRPFSPLTEICLKRRVRERGVHGEAHPDAEEPVPRTPEDGRAEEERGHDGGGGRGGGTGSRGRRTRQQRRPPQRRRQRRPARISKTDGELITVSLYFFLLNTEINVPSRGGHIRVHTNTSF